MDKTFKTIYILGILTGVLIMSLGFALGLLMQVKLLPIFKQIVEYVN